MQVTVNGTNMEISELEGRRLEFLVLGVQPLFPDAILGPITLRIVGKHQIIRTSNMYCYHIIWVLYDTEKKKFSHFSTCIFHSGCVLIVWEHIG